MARDRAWIDPLFWIVTLWQAAHMVKLVLQSIAFAIAAMALNVACAFLWVAIYSHLIAPGQSEAAYEAYAMRATPWSAIIAGIPILFGAGWLLARWHGGGWRTGIGVAIAYAAMDFLILLAFNALLVMPGIVLLSDATKLAAAALGGRIAARRAIAAS
jgi:hypothetical protein